jgi:transcriptional regulator of acetoin/glycerol metabolism
VIERVFALGTGATIEPSHLPPEIRGDGRPPAATPGSLPTLQSSQAELVRRALEESKGNKSMAARKLGIDRKRLYRLIRRYGLADSGAFASSMASGGQR